MNRPNSVILAIFESIMHLTILFGIYSMALLAVTAAPIDSGFVGFPVGPPGTVYFVKAQAIAADKANTESAAANHFDNHVDSSAGNIGLQEDVVFMKNHASAAANDRGFDDAIAKKNAIQMYDANQVAKGAVFFGRRLDDFECGARDVVLAAATAAGTLTTPSLRQG
ncbi:hypothetical protein DYB32_003123 [Aphanomyces invadans]|uniref:Uncharacterized protein n=1 Tax=Aphanomyces invadans TaxID=157072 RepID=A0A418B511_9STRA|nr:hypothetical protein DYB32_003123 [Aphanomyces invadans]